MTVQPRTPTCPCCGQPLPSRDAELEARISFVAGWAGQTAANLLRTLYQEPQPPHLPALTAIPHLEKDDGHASDYDALRSWYIAAKDALAQGDIDQAARFLAVVQRGVELHAALYPEEERWTRRNLASLWIDLGIIAEAKVDIPEAILCYRRGLEWANKHPNNNIRRRLIANLKRLGVEVE